MDTIEDMRRESVESTGLTEETIQDIVDERNYQRMLLSQTGRVGLEILLWVFCFTISYILYYLSGLAIAYIKLNLWR